ncbi:MAG: YbjN domain-containing protein [Lachnospiraceae bacterium]|nr:YbjN domain-containing protein [Lachnospiraceae bacterium]
MESAALKRVSEVLETKDIRADWIADNVLRTDWEFAYGRMIIFLQIDDEDTHVHLEGINFIKIPEDRYDIIFRMLNECNDAYNHVKFVLNTSGPDVGQISAREDDIIQLDSCGPECFELMLRMVRIVEDAYPKFMKVLWGGETLSIDVP